MERNHLPNTPHCFFENGICKGYIDGNIYHRKIKGIKYEEHTTEQIRHFQSDSNYILLDIEIFPDGTFIIPSEYYL